MLTENDLNHEKRFKIIIEVDTENKILVLLCNIMVICHVYSIDIEWYVKQRMRYNECKTNQ